MSLILILTRNHFNGQDLLLKRHIYIRYVIHLIYYMTCDTYGPDVATFKPGVSSAGARHHNMENGALKFRQGRRTAAFKF